MRFKDMLRKSILVKKVLKYRYDRKTKWRRDGIEKYGVECLLIIREIFKAHNQEFWLDYGTLLGAIREKDFISHDLDMDIGTFNISEQKKEEIEESLKNKGIIKIKEFRVNNNIAEQTFVYKDAYVDIFYYHESIDKKVWCYFFEETDRIERIYSSDEEEIVIGWRAKTATSTLLGIENLEFKGEIFPVPSNYEQYVIENYGPNYMIKDKNWDYANSGKNIDIVEINDIKAAFKVV
ncbi:LicD family protein [Bacillus mobilis]|uniref:LicD family protein n=1 Tax=Bacillus mobilis TaxID=2026190 RepID=UPI002FDC153E